MQTQEPIDANARVVCKTCGKKHQLKRGIDAPVYWCGNELRKLQAGDVVEYEEVEQDTSK